MKSTNDMGFDGLTAQSPARSSTRFAKNQFSGHSNDGRLVQMGQQPNRVGNDGKCHDPTHGPAKARPTADPVRGRPGNPDSMNFGSQHRGGGTAEPKRGGTEFNVGRGPTKGNQQ